MDSNFQQDEIQSSSFHRFAQRAMATIFEIFIDHEDHRYAQQAAYAAFEELQRLENELSCFIETSEVSIINKSPVHYPVQVSIDILRCLQLAEKYYSLTNGAFNITSGKIINYWKNQVKQNKTNSIKIHNQFGIAINKETLSVTRLDNDALIDLGGMGKGFALDMMKDVLLDWDIKRAVLHCGWSTVLAMDPPHDREGWLFTLRHPHTQELLQTVALSNQAISGSGMQKGSHIVNPKTGEAVNHILATWVRAKNAAAADAFSTACMILQESERERIKVLPSILSIKVVPMPNKIIRNQITIR